MNYAVKSGGRWSRETVDSAENVGAYSSFAVDSSGKAHIRYSDEEKGGLIEEAEEYAGEDKKKKEEVEIQNSTESMIYTAEKTKTDLKDKISKEQDEKPIFAVTDTFMEYKGHRYTPQKYEERIKNLEKRIKDLERHTQKDGSNHT